MGFEACFGDSLKLTNVSRILWEKIHILGGFSNIKGFQRVFFFFFLSFSKFMGVEVDFSCVSIVKMFYLSLEVITDRLTSVCTRHWYEK